VVRHWSPPAERPLLDRNRDLQETGDDKEADRPDAGRHHGLYARRRVVEHLTDGRRHEARHHQPHGLVDPDPDDGGDARQREELGPTPDRVQRQDHAGDDEKGDRAPDPRHEGAVAAEPEVEVAGRDAVLRLIVEVREELDTDQEQVHLHGHGQHEGEQVEDPLFDRHAADPAEGLEGQDQQCGAPCERGRHEARAHDRRVPERPAHVRGEEERGHRYSWARRPGP
jgi:hypothetical protein